MLGGKALVVLVFLVPLLVFAKETALICSTILAWQQDSYLAYHVQQAARASCRHPRQHVSSQMENGSLSRADRQTAFVVIASTVYSKPKGFGGNVDLASGILALPYGTFGLEYHSGIVIWTTGYTCDTRI